MRIDIWVDTSSKEWIYSYDFTLGYYCLSRYCDGFHIGEEIMFGCFNVKLSTKAIGKVVNQARGVMDRLSAPVASVMVYQR